MANGVTVLGGGWDQVPVGDGGGVYAEFSLGVLLTRGGTMTDRVLERTLDELGFAERGPLFYPDGPYYALGVPHTYCALNPTRSFWDLIGFDLRTARRTVGGRVPDPIVTGPTCPKQRTKLLELAFLAEKLARDLQAAAADARDVAGQA